MIPAHAFLHQSGRGPHSGSGRKSGKADKRRVLSKRRCLRRHLLQVAVHPTPLAPGPKSAGAAQAAPADGCSRYWPLEVRDPPAEEEQFPGGLPASGCEMIAKVRRRAILVGRGAHQSAIAVATIQPIRRGDLLRRQCQWIRGFLGRLPTVVEGGGGSGCRPFVLRIPIALI